MTRSLVGMTFGRLKVTAQAPSVVVATTPKMKYRSAWVCQCECGSVVTLNANRLRTGNTKSCGCLKRDVTSARRRSHGHTVGGFSPTFNSWRAMVERCTNTKNAKYDLYGGRGIRVCERWLGVGGFANFLEDMGERPDSKTLDRIDTDGHYELANCRWATRKEQGRNRRGTKLSMEKAAEIRRRYAAGETQASIGRDFGVSQVEVSEVVLGKLWT